jgi:hypothetical protein
MNEIPDAEDMDDAEIDVDEIPDEIRDFVSRCVGMERAREISDYNTVEGMVESLKREVQFGMGVGDAVVGIGYTMGVIQGVVQKCVHLYGLKRGVTMFTQVLRRPIEEILAGTCGSMLVSETFVDDAIDMAAITNESEEMDEEVQQFFADREIASAGGETVDDPEEEDKV